MFDQFAFSPIENFDSKWLIHSRIHQYKDQILYAVEKKSVLICEADTGSGKSTQIAQYLAEAGYSEGDDDRKYMIAVTQPR